MKRYFEPQPAGHPGAMDQFDDWQWSGRRFGPPLPLKILLVVAAFWIFPPLGIAALAWLLCRTAWRNGGCVFRREGIRRSFERGAWGRPATRNSAFEERRREVLRELDEDAEAFNDFERRQREARDKEAFDRFMAGRNAPKSSDL